MNSHNHGGNAKAISDIAITAAGYILRTAAIPIVSTLRIISNNLFASLFLGASMGMVFVGRRQNTRIIRLSYYITAIGLLGTHCLIMAVTYSPIITVPDIPK